MDIFRLSEMKDKNFSKAISELYQITSFNNKQYPEYLKWFYSVNIPRVLRGEGDVLFGLDGFMVKGLLVLKDTKEEKKICTLFVDDDYRHNKVGTILLQESFKQLNTEHPVITIPEKNISQFNYFINEFGWKETGVSDSYYSPEIHFN